MKKLIILAAMVLTIGVANANAGVSFEVSVGHNPGKGYSRGGHGGGYGYYAPPHAPPRYVVRECLSCRPHYQHGYWGHRRGHGHSYGRGHSHGHGHGHRR